MWVQRGGSSLERSRERPERPLGMSRCNRRRSRTLWSLPFSFRPAFRDASRLLECSTCLLLAGTFCGASHRRRRSKRPIPDTVPQESRNWIWPAPYKHSAPPAASHYPGMDLLLVFEASCSGAEVALLCQVGRSAGCRFVRVEGG